MSKSKKALIQLGLALILALVAGAVIFRWTNNMKRPAPVAAVKTSTVPVVVAKAAAKRGMKLTGEMLEVRNFTADSRPEGSHAQIQELAGRVLNQDVGPNEAVTDRKLADASVMGGGVSAMIEPGKRAMAVKGNMVMGLSGFVRPGDKVDVIVAMTVGSDEKPVTKLVLEQVKVLATGTQLQPPTEDGMTASVDVYTLELSPAESERLALAASRGTLHFALRNEQDEAAVLTSGSDIPKTLAALRPKLPPRSVRQATRIEVLSGASRSTVKF
ncbi:Flp pilus assembly protein CpaB [uncultured Pseudodesulfovibrio sp.]|uniref:Flp pilus assembly protein CpaB n=1 Tax=uncultured Pseudodesulfovibrio sp. TaxID=2035858 RepID=UPI0029C99912|nr:Flp pilus assembly protein CpaB [uncultured Pseudodesulfovibrio sp.]